MERLSKSATDEGNRHANDCTVIYTLSSDSIPSRIVRAINRQAVL